MCDVRPSLADVAPHFPHDAYVIVAVEKVVLVFSSSRTPAGAVRGLVRLEGRIGEDNDEALGVLVVACYGDVLFSD